MPLRERQAASRSAAKRGCATANVEDRSISENRLRNWIPWMPPCPDQVVRLHSRAEKAKVHDSLAGAVSWRDARKFN